MSEDRRRQIIERIEAEGRVRVEDLSEKFEVSQVTIRKDLAELKITEGTLPVIERGFDRKDLYLKRK